MDTIPFAETETAVANERHHHLEILKNKDLDFNDMKSESKDFDKWETNVLVDYIINTHHDFAKKNAVIIYNLAQKVTYRHSDNHPELRTLSEIIFLFLHDLLNQMLKEEQYIFPYIRQKEKDRKYAKINDNNISQSLKEKIKLLQNAHEKAFRYLKVLRQVTNNFRIPYDACNSYNALFEKIKELEDDLNMHFHLENDILFPNAIAAYKYD